MSNDEHLYRTVGMLLSGVPSMAVTVLLVLSLSVGIVLAAAIGIAVGLIGSGAGAAVGAEVYARRERGEGWPR
jgi:hypothetical protein